MVVKGDTVEYNAAAFRLSQGSMLDNLVRALPGAKINDDGQIYLNGEFVSSLLINGRDFFNGDPKVALHNLPAYTVSKIKAYHKSDKARIAGQALTEDERRKAPLVMDVSLKREYAQGWISNYEAGGGSSLSGGSKGFWLGRMFAMRYTNHSSLAVYAASNNLNDAMDVGGKGEWKKVDITAGQTTTHMVGANFTLDPKDTKLSLTSSIKARQQRPLTETWTNSEDYYASSTIYNRGNTWRHTINTSLDWEGNLRWNPRRFFIDFNPKVSYSHNKTNERNMSFNEQSVGAGVDSLYKRENATRQHENVWNLGGRVYGFFMLGKGLQMVDYEVSIDYQNRKRTEDIDDDVLYTRAPESNLSELRRRNMPSHDYTLATDWNYQNYEVVKTDRMKLGLFLHYTFDQRFTSAHQDLERSDSTGLTPSTDAARFWWTDAQNSYHTTTMSRRHAIQPSIRLQLGDFSVSFSSSMHDYNRRISDLRVATTQNRKSDAFTYDPDVSLSWNHKAHTINLRGALEHELPDLPLLLDIADGTDPLIVQRGNSALANARKYSASFTYKAQLKHPTQLVNIRAGYDYWLDRVAMAQLYDKQTGVTTFMPFNVDGNRSFLAKANYEITFGGSGNWSIGNELRFQLARSVDFSSDNLYQEVATQAVRNTFVREELRADYRTGNLRVGMKVFIHWTRQKSEQHFFDTMHYSNQGYGITLSTPLFWGIDFDTDLMLYRRAGYDNPSMNATDWVWNASLMRSFGKRKQWTVKAIGFDMLHELSNVRREINAQGHTETRYNTLPSYALLSLVYRLDVKPKKKRE